MKVDKSKLKKSSSELTPECKQLIDEITKYQSNNEILKFLETVQLWVYGKCELYHWITILDRFDTILEDAARNVDVNEFQLNCDSSFSAEDTRLLLLVLNFTTLLIEHSFSRHLYNSIEHLTQLLSSQNMDIVLAVLNLLYMFSKRSNFIPRLSFEKKEMLLMKLFNIAERWGDPNYGLALIDCCVKKPKTEFLDQFLIEYVDVNGDTCFLEIPDMMSICNDSPPFEVLKTICENLPNPSNAVKMRLAHRVRLVTGFKDYKTRLQFIQARLQAVSVLIYSNALQENIDKILYPGFGEELCELLDKEHIHLVDIRAAVLRTLTSMLHFDRNPNVPRPGSRLSKIIQYTGAERQSGILPLLVRDCIGCLTGDGASDKYPLILATSLFSLLYHLASYEAGGHALVKSGMMQSLLRVIGWPGVGLEHITFVTRAVRVIDLITNIDIAKFHQHNGLTIFIDRLEKEINGCRESIAESNNITINCRNLLAEYNGATASYSDVLPGEIFENRTERRNSSDSDVIFIESTNINIGGRTLDFRHQAQNLECETSSLSEETIRYPSDSYYARPPNERNLENIYSSENELQKKCICITQRAALLKSMLNFLKKSIQDHVHFNGMRNVMETSLPSSLRHIISNAEYYGPSLFLLATDVVTVYVFNEPSLLSTLQDSGITNVILQSLLRKHVPSTREVLGSLPNVFSALCLNERGLMEFMSYEPFDKILKVLLSPEYLVAMRRRRSSDPLGDTATNLGNAMDDLMKHHPYLRTDATEAIVRLLNELVRLGSDRSFICWRANKENNCGNATNSSSGSNNIPTTTNNSQRNMTNTNMPSEVGNNENNDSSGDDDDDDDEMSSASQQQQRHNRTSLETQPQAQVNNHLPQREAIPLIDYILNVMKFIEAIFTNSSNGEHCREFVLHGGLTPLLQLLSLPNLPVDSPVSTTAQAVANVCKSILNLAHESKVIDTTLQQLALVVDKLKPLIKNFDFPCESILLHELLNCPNIDDGFSTADYTPLLHSMSSVHGYVVLLVHICRSASNEMRLKLLKRWADNSVIGLKLLQNLVHLYISLVWESTILLSLCSEDARNTNSDEFLLTSDSSSKEENEASCENADDTTHKNENAIKLKPEEQLRYIKSLLAASSRLGRALAELFGTLVKLSVGSPQSRQRRNNDFVTSISSSKFPTADAKEIARVLSSILVNGFCHENIMPKPAAKLKLTFLICSVGFTGPMLFDDKRSCFHLMLSQFCEENGLRAFFDMFFWALSLDGHLPKFSFDYCVKMKTFLEDSEDDSHAFPDGTGEFLDAWLQLLEKMVNPRAILESPYAISPRAQSVQEVVQFEPIFYLILTHQLAIQAIKRIWKRRPIANYGVSMTESIMTTLKHLVKSHAMLREKYQSRLIEIKNAAKVMDDNRIPIKPLLDEAHVNMEYFKTLTDMGFMRHYVLEALQNTHTLEQATDYLLNHTEARELAMQSREQIDSIKMDIDVDNPLLCLPTTSKGDPTNSNSNVKKNWLEINLISTHIFQTFCKEILERTFIFMEYLPETVNSGADLLSVLYRCHCQSDKPTFAFNIIKHLTESIDQVLGDLQKTDTLKTETLEDLISGSSATKLFIQLKASTLLLDETHTDMRKDLCYAVTQLQTFTSLIKLINKTENIVKDQKSIGSKIITPRWLQSLIEFIDSVQNVFIIMQRKSNMRAVSSENWKWYDTSAGKWNSYSESNNILLKTAFNNGERSVGINIGRQRYTVNFNCMTQVSEASGSHRPVLPALKINEAIGNFYGGNSNTKIENILTRRIKSKSDGIGITQHDEMLCLRSLLNFTTIESSSNVFDSKDNKDDQTTKKENNVEFPISQKDDIAGNGKNVKTKEAKGTCKTSKLTTSNLKRAQKVILHEESVGLSQSDAADIISSLVRMLHPTLSLNFETKLSILKLCARLTKDYENAKIFFKNGGVNILLHMQQACGIMGFPTYAIVIIRHIIEAPSVLQESIERVLSSRTAQSVSVGHRDLIYVLTQVSSAVARHPGVFSSAAKQVLRADYVVNSTFSVDDSRFVVKSAHSNRKCCNVSSYSNSKFDEGLTSSQIPIKVIKELLHAVVQPCIHYGDIVENYSKRTITKDDRSEEPSAKLTNKLSESFESCCCSWHIPSSGHLHQKPILPRSTLLKILSDAVRSYQFLVPQIIIDHVYSPADSLLIKKNQSFLSFILDNFLPIVRRQQDSEVSMMSRVLISSLSDCYGNTVVQNKIVEEIHEAIVRSLANSLSSEKHIRLQVLISLFPAMIDSPLLSNKIHLQRNNMYRVLLRQGIMTDLAKISQYKDLSNPKTLTTIQSILRPMEILLRLTVAPGTLSSKRIFYGTAPQGNYSISNRRFYPRLTSRSTYGSNSIGGEHVLRDIIRNVLSDRRQAFDFILNAEDMFIDSDDATQNNAGAADDEIGDNERSTRVAVTLSNGRPQINFDRLWDDLIQNENFRLVSRNTNISGANNVSNLISNNDLNSSNDDEVVNNDNVASGGSDGASTSSETAVVVENSASLLGDVSTSDSDSDSNVSTENDDRNEDEDDDEEEDDDDGNDEGVEDRSETDADEETRQYIEVFDHIYEPESSETASNDADVDADDEASEIGAGINANNLSNRTVAETSSSEVQMPIVVERHVGRPSDTLEQTQSILFISSSDSLNNGNSHTIASNITENASESSMRTNPASSWIGPQINFVETDDNHLTHHENIEVSNNEGVRSNNGRNENNTANVASILQSNSNINNSQPPNNRRESARRLVFLDQQYCVSMPTFCNPTEEGQIELFNQDALHWWLEEAKHLDLESQTDVCVYVAHILIPYLIKELKTMNNQKKPDLTNVGSIATRRSAIPILVQQALSPVTAQTTANNTDVSSPADFFQESSQTAVLETTVATGLSEVSQNSAEEYNYEHTTQRNFLSMTDASSSEHTMSSDTNGIEDNYEGTHCAENEEMYDEETPSNERCDDNVDIEYGNETQTQSQSAPEIIDSEPGNNHIYEHVENFVMQESNAGEELESTEIVDSVEQRVSSVCNEESPSSSIPEVNASNIPSQLLRETVDNFNETPAVPDSLYEIRTSTNATQMSPEVRAALGDLVVPEGVDPSFLAALPSEMREEVIQEHLRMQRIRQRAQQNAIQVAHESLLEVNPEFLAALPPNIQSEVLMQQRIEQQRQAAQSVNPDEPVDTAAFFQNLPESLRRAILTDMDESQIVSLPADLAAEAQYLRRDWETRNGPRLDTTQSNTLSGFLTARFPSSLQNLNEESRWHSNSIWYDANGMPQSQHHQHTTIVHQQQVQGKPIALLLMEDENNLLDPDSLASLLLFLFIEDPKLNTTRVHRVIRNLSYHMPTREWIIKALISIIQKTNNSNIYSIQSVSKPQWLRLRVDAAFGYKSNVFFIDKLHDANYNINVNPQAAQMVVKNCLDMLFVLAKHFPRSFLPFSSLSKEKSKHVGLNASQHNCAGETNNEIYVTSDHNEATPEEIRGILQHTVDHSSIANLNVQSTSRSLGNIAINKKLDDCPSTSKAAAIRPNKTHANINKLKTCKVLEYKTNASSFWEVLLNIEIQTQYRLANIHAFPILSQPIWDWGIRSQDFVSLKDSAFAKLLEMLPYKVICRSPQLTDMLVKLLAFLSSELPKEEELSEQTFDESNRSAKSNISMTDENVNKNRMSTEIGSDDNKTKQQSTTYKLKRKMYSKNFSQLQLIIEILTNQCGTVEGLDNISKLIVNLSQCSLTSNAIFLQYLSAAILGLAEEVREAIQKLLEEIRVYKSRYNKNTIDSSKHFSTYQNNLVQQGIMQDRFTSENVVISAPVNITPSCELQLPAMKKLLSSSAAQIYFLRTLKIFIQVRELFESQENRLGCDSTGKPILSQILCLDGLWNTLSQCLVALEEPKDEYAVLVLQPTVEAFFLIHASYKKNMNQHKNNSPDVNDSQNANTRENIFYSPPIDEPEHLSHQYNAQNASNTTNSLFSNVSDSELSGRETQLKIDRQKFLQFAEKHRTVLNQILRQSSTHLSDGPFAVLVDHTRILDFDVKRKYFQTELERIDEGVRREENTVSVRRVTVFEDSFRVLYRLGPEDWKNRFYIVFEDEEGQDAGGLLREWYVIISREIFNPMYALFCVSPGDRVTYMINPSSHANPNHLSYFKFVGRIIAKAIHDNKLLECYFTRSFYKHILGKQVKYTDMESQDYEFYKGLDYLMKNNISSLGYELTFSTEVQEFGVTQVRDLIQSGRDIAVTEENKFDYVQLVCQLKMSDSIRQQLDAFLEGFYDIIPKHLISIFNEQELELLISGLPDIDIEDLKANTEYHKYNSKSIQIQWFWRALRSFDQADRAKFLQFVTGTSKVPLQGFGSLEGMNGIQKFQVHRDDRSTDRLPCAHTCFNQLDLPMYKSYEKLRSCLLKAIHECSEGFGFA